MPSSDALSDVYEWLASIMSDTERINESNRNLTANHYQDIILRQLALNSSSFMPTILSAKPLSKKKTITKQKPLTIYMRKGDPKGVLWIKLPHGKDVSICGSSWWATFYHQLKDHGELDITDEETARSLFLCVLKTIRDRIKKEGADFGERDPEIDDFHRRLREASEEMVISDDLAEAVATPEENEMVQGIQPNSIRSRISFIA